SGGSCARRALSSSLLEELSQHGFDLGVVEAPQRARALDGVEHALELVENDDVLDVDETPDQLGLLPFDLRPYGHRYRTSRAETTAALPRVAVRRAPCGRGRPGPGARRAWRDPSREPGERGPSRLGSRPGEGRPAAVAGRHPACLLAAGSLHGHALGQVARLVDVAAQTVRDLVGQ